MSYATLAAGPRSAAPTLTPPRARFVLGWVLAWAAVGTAVAGGIAFGTGRELGPTLLLSVLFAEVVGLTAYTSARFVFPLLERLPFALRLLLELATVLAGSLFGSITVFWVDPLYIAAQPRAVLTVVLVNAAIAAVVGLALHTYDNLRRQLEESYRQLRENEALERELVIAREVQQQLLPRAVLRMEGLELAGVCRPAIGVGGDYYDFLPAGDRVVGLVIADVSGKGFPAALLMAGLQASVRSLIGPVNDPWRLHERLNEQLCASSQSSRYATMFLGMYDARSRRLSYSNAGHLPPLLVRGEQVVRLAQGGLPIGMFTSITYPEGRHEMLPGDLLALFTDGVVESPDAQGVEYGEERLIRTLREHRDDDLDTLLAAVLGDLDRWSAGAAVHDDVTLLLARVP